jgi:hypothetical protein
MHSIADPIREGADQIDKKTMEISQADDVIYSDLKELGEELPDHTPRFILLSYPLTLVCLRPPHTLQFLLQQWLHAIHVYKRAYARIFLV